MLLFLSYLTKTQMFCNLVLTIHIIVKAQFYTCCIPSIRCCKAKWCNLENRKKPRY